MEADAAPGAPAGRPVDVTWDEGLAPQRTELAWGRTGLAVLVASAILVRRVLVLPVGGAVVVSLLVAAGAATWLAGMRWSRRLMATGAPHGIAGHRAFALVAGGTVLLALAGLLLGLFFPA